jgi:hypothetical protein
MRRQPAIAPFRRPATLPAMNLHALAANPSTTVSYAGYFYFTDISEGRARV